MIIIQKIYDASKLYYLFLKSQCIQKMNVKEGKQLMKK